MPDVVVDRGRFEALAAAFRDQFGNLPVTDPVQADRLARDALQFAKRQAVHLIGAAVLNGSGPGAVFLEVLAERDGAATGQLGQFALDVALLDLVEAASGFGRVTGSVRSRPGPIGQMRSNLL